MSCRTKGTILITGGAKRIGKAICLGLANEGYAIALHYHRSSKAAKALKRRIDSISRCHLVKSDLSDEKQIDSLIKTTKKKAPDLCVLINNASVFKKSTIRASTPESFDRDINIHLKAPFFLSRDFANICKKGNIINILDAAIVKDKSEHASYLLAKKALASLTTLAAVEFAPRIRVNGIAPGLILAPEGKGAAYLKKRARNIPLKKKGDPQQIVESVKFLLNNTFVTGQIIFNDGGEHLT